MNDVDVDGDSVPDHGLTSSYQDDLEARFESPLSIAAGASYDFGATALHVSAEWFDRVEAFKVIQPQPFQSQSTGQTFSPRVVYAAKSVTNFGLGVQHSVHDELAFYAGFTADHAAVDQETSTDVALATWVIRATMKENASITAPSPPKSRLIWGIAVLILGNVGAPLCIPLVTGMELSAGIKTAISGLLLLGIPELSILAAVAILGKTGFAWVKSKVLGFLKQLGPPEQVSRSRYRAGLVVFTALLVWAWLEPYVGTHLPGYADHRMAFALCGDVFLLLSLIVLGGEFWDKLRALFVPEARATFPHLSDRREP